MKPLRLISLFLFIFLFSCGSQEITQTNKPVNVLPTPTTFNPLDIEKTQVGVLVSFSDDQNSQYALEFNETTVSAIEALKSTNLNLSLLDFGSGLGQAICAIEGVGGTSTACFVKDLSWFVFKRTYQGQWIDPQLGASSVVLQDGDMVAFVWSGFDENYFSLRKPDEKYDISSVFEQAQ